MDWNCNSCGACCVGMRVPVPAGENIRGHVGEVNKALKKRRLPLIDRDNFMPATDTACDALGGTVGTPKANCTIYEDRPEVCQQFAVGSYQCVTLRVLHGIDTAPDVVKMVSTLQRRWNVGSGVFPRDLVRSLIKYYAARKRKLVVAMLENWLHIDDERRNDTPPTMGADGVERERHLAVLEKLKPVADSDERPARKPRKATKKRR